MSQRRSQRGQVLVLFAVAAVVLFGMAAIALDQGIGMADRRDLQAYADSAALAGAREYNLGHGSDSAHLTALLVLKSSLPISSGFTFPLSGTDQSGGSITCSQTLVVCPAGSYQVGSSSDYTITLKDSGTSSLDVGITHSRRTLVAGVLGFSTAVTGTSARGTQSASTTSSVNYAFVALGGDAGVDGGGTSLPSGDVSGMVYSYGSFGGNNGPHTVQMPSTVMGTSSSGSVGTCSPSVSNEVETGGSAWSGKPYYSIGSGTNNSLVTNVARPATFPSLQPTATGGTYATAASGYDAIKLAYKPGTYQQVLPHNAALEPGIFAFVSLNNIDMTGWHNLGSPSPDITVAGTEDTSGAVAIVLDSTDTGNVTLDGVSLNGLDAISTTSDAEGTHNFVLYGETYTGSVTIGANNTSTITGVVDLPNSSFTSNGNPTFHFYGAVYVSNMNVSGGGNGAQTFTYVCGLRTVNSSVTTGGLVR